MQDENSYVSLDNIASTLNLPKQFTARILKTMVKAKILSSQKGPTGGFIVTKNGLQLKLQQLLEIINGYKLNDCIMKSEKCNSLHPCPAHFYFTKARQELIAALCNTTIAELLHATK
jgi:Rrf2 family protein